jgi:hypothetical protein
MARSLMRHASNNHGFAVSSCLALTALMGCSSSSTPATHPEDGGGTEDAVSSGGPADSGEVDSGEAVNPGVDSGTAPQSDAGVIIGPMLDGAPPQGNWINVTANLAQMSSECGNMTYVSAKPDEDLLIAGIALDGLWGSHDGGQSWQAMGKGSGSATITNRPSAIVYDPQNSMRYWESGIYNGNGVYRTADDGTTFTQLGTAIGADSLSIDFSDANRQTLLAGGHEMSQTLQHSSNGGMAWNNIGAGLPANTNCTYPLVIDSQTYLAGCGGYGGGPSGIYRTTTSGGSWTNVSTAGGIDTPLVASDGSIYWSTPNGKGVTRSTDHGVTWSAAMGSGSVASTSPIELPDGRIATLGPKYVMVSGDHGATWNPASDMLPYNDGVGVAYSSQQKAFFIWHFTCGNPPVPVPADAIMRFNFNYQTN